MRNLIAVLSLVALAACSETGPAPTTSTVATTPAPSGITASSGGGMQAVDPQSYRGTIGTTRTR